MSYRPHPPPTRLHRLYDPVADLPPDHLARWVEAIVEAAVTPVPHPPGRGQSPYDPRLTVKVLVYGYATGTRSSRQLARLCRESLPYLFLTRGDHPSHTTLCDARRDEEVPAPSQHRGHGYGCCMRRAGDARRQSLDIGMSIAKQFTQVVDDREQIVRIAVFVQEPQMSALNAQHGVLKLAVENLIQRVA